MCVNIAKRKKVRSRYITRIFVSTFVVTLHKNRRPWIIIFFIFVQQTEVESLFSFVTIPIKITLLTNIVTKFLFDSNDNRNIRTIITYSYYQQIFTYPNRLTLSFQKIKDFLAFDCDNEVNCHGRDLPTTCKLKNSYNNKINILIIII